MKINSPKKIAGVTLIEVMISVLIMGIGMLGIAAMQTTALRNNQGALRRTEVVMQTYTILDAMRANRDVALIGGYNTTNMLCTAPTGSGLPDRDRALWLTGLKNALGNSESTCGLIACNDGNCRITIRWDDSRSKNLNADGESAEELTTVTQL
ncbi:type IV pilus modification protein PilV [Xanthomonas campestris]|uniref:type IV pilus modification protein PilV n=1 Tax=Xanthomonas campestris TaxID=339 RepID=UPI0023659CA2|nr:type IV pilus modification protein PilV [Xanthomonas campestris]MEA9710798.1 type IV pilus modification protein PilV [Xanthomonas campestris]MEA9781856.1 type IV pilus modification protein PilV [Xanthomonas campestris pv. raphani]MEA9790364.1 type IV pilus modification protein PilV [Xanthomonas campestris pv. raphani]MEA9794448.1 type IV pilus modification protein PilV [Xanthomonas campestris pv. raphani]MEA9802114.1 type IV pilus modification protein PilV [Xanthomonas campestris pv. raphan